MTETILPAKLKIFTVCPFKKTFANSWFRGLNTFNEFSDFQTHSFQSPYCEAAILAPHCNQDPLGKPRVNSFIYCTDYVHKELNVARWPSQLPIQKTAESCPGRGTSHCHGNQGLSHSRTQVCEDQNHHTLPEAPQVTKSNHSFHCLLHVSIQAIEEPWKCIVEAKVI